MTQLLFRPAALDDAEAQIAPAPPGDDQDLVGADLLVAGEGADAAFLLEPTPVADIAAVAEAGDVMPQKSTYFYPKPLSGLVVNPHEW